MASYQIDISREVHAEIRRLPGNMRQRVLRTLQGLQDEPRPHNSKSLDLSDSGIELASKMDLRRIRMDAWRIVYLIEEDTGLVTVLAIRKRPPYQCQ